VYPFVGIAETGAQNPGSSFALAVTPNPMKTNLQIGYSTGRNAQDASLCIYDVIGRLVKTFCLEPAAERPARIIWSGCDDNGRPCASGIYFCCLRCGDQIIVEKIVRVY
jgi:hypothetical protein